MTIPAPLTADRIIAAGRRGSSRPVLVETARGTRLLKLRGSGQGTGPLVAEIIVGNLAETLGLSVPPRSLIELRAGIPVADWDDELADLLAASVGLNLGFDYLEGAHEYGPDDARRIGLELRSAILWLDRLVCNPDRTEANPHLLDWSGDVWLIDHGAALGFQYGWERVTEMMPREPWLAPDAHLFDPVVSTEELRAADERLAPLLSREALERAVADVPDDFIATGVDPVRRRAAYVAWLWKRLRAPRPFLEPWRAPDRPPRGRPPAWLSNRKRER